jgi:hypothetical protein
MKDKVHKFSNGVRVLNCTKHALNFQEADGSVVVVEPSGFTVDATVSEAKSRHRSNYFGVDIVMPTYTSDVNTEERLDELQVSLMRVKTDKPMPVILIGSQIAAQAYPGRIAALIPVTGFERAQWDQKRMRIDKFTMF